MVSHCSFDFVCISVPVDYSDIFFGKRSVQVLCPFLIRLFEILLSNDMSSLYIWGINTLSDTRFASIFFPFLRLLFHFIDCFFRGAEAL